MQDDLLEFGKIIIDNEDEENVKAIFMDRDFRNKTVFNLICTNGYVPLMLDKKVTSLVEELWEGKLT